MQQDTLQTVRTNYYITEHFRYTDLICPCCDLVMLTPGVFRHMAELEELRRRVGFGIIVTSGYRCRAHNRAVGGVPRSWHLLFATDMVPADGDISKLTAMEAAARELKFGGIGLYENHIHVDLRPARTIWRG